LTGGRLVMKKLLAAALAALSLSLNARGQLAVQFSPVDSLGRPAILRPFVIYPLDAPFNSGSNQVSRDRISLNTGPTGSFIVSNLVGQDFMTVLSGSFTSTTNYYSFPVTNGLVLANPYLGAPTNAPGFAIAYPEAVSDARYWAKAGLVAGTNTTFRTNGAVVFIDTTGSGGGQATNAPDVAAGTNISIVTNGLLRTISATGGGAVLVSVANSNVLVLSGFGANWTTITNDNNGSYILGPVFNAGMVNGTNYWNAASGSYTNASSGVGVYYDSEFTGIAWITNSQFLLTIDEENGLGSGIGAVVAWTPSPFIGSVDDGYGVNSGIPTNGLSAFGSMPGGALAVYAGGTNYLGTNAPMSFSGTFNGPLKGNVTGNVVGNVTGNVNGTLSGKLAVSNVNAFTNLDDVSYIGWLKGNFDSFASWNRGGTSNTFWHIRNNQPFTVLWLGDGNLFDDLSITVYSNLLGAFGIAGVLSEPVAANGGQRAASLTPVSYTSVSNGGGVGAGVAGNNPSTGMDSIWMAPHWSITNNTAWVKEATSYPYPSDNYEVDYVKTPVGGAFEIWTNAGGAWGKVTALTGFNASGTNGAAYAWTNSGGVIPGTMTIMVTNTAAGTNNWVGVAWNNSTVVGGARIFVFAAQSSGAPQFCAAPMSAYAPIFASWNPSLTLLFMPYGSNPGFPASYTTNYESIVRLIRTNTPSSDLVLASEVLNDTVDTPLREAWLCRTNNPNSCYFDGMGMFSLTNWPNTRGWFSGDGGHMTEAGYTAYSQTLWNWLGLTEAGSAGAGALPDPLTATSLFVSNSISTPLIEPINPAGGLALVRPMLEFAAMPGVSMFGNLNIREATDGADDVVIGDAAGDKVRFQGGNGPLDGLWATNFYGNGFGITNLNASQLTSGTVPLQSLPLPVAQLGTNYMGPGVTNASGQPIASAIQGIIQSGATTNNGVVTLAASSAGAVTNNSTQGTVNLQGPVNSTNGVYQGVATLAFTGFTNVLVDFSTGTRFKLLITTNVWLIPSNINTVLDSDFVLKTLMASPGQFTVNLGTNTLGQRFTLPGGVSFTATTNVGAADLYSMMADYTGTNVAIVLAPNFK